MNFRDVSREQTTIPFTEQRHTAYRIVINNQDNPPLPITGIRATGNEYALKFLPVKGAAYRVYYGSEHAAPPHYEVAPVLELLRQGFHATDVALGPQSESAAMKVNAGYDWVALLNSQFFLGLAITLMVPALAWALFRAAKRIDLQ